MSPYHILVERDGIEWNVFMDTLSETELVKLKHDLVMQSRFPMAQKVRDFQRHNDAVDEYMKNVFRQSKKIK